MMVLSIFVYFFFFFFKQKTAYEMRISDWSSDVCSSDLPFQCTTTPLFNDENWNSMQFRSPSYFHRQWKRFRSKKNTASRIMRYAAQLLLNADELIIFGKAIGTRQAASLDLTAISGHR